MGNIPVLKPKHTIFSLDHNNVLQNILPHFNVTKDMKKAEAVLLWQDVTFYGLKYAKRAKELGKPVIVVQHGRWAFRDYLPPVNYKLLADKLCVWGTRDHEWMMNAGFDRNRVILTGCPILDNLNREKIAHEGANVVFAPLHSDREIEGNTAIIDHLRKIGNINIISKILHRNVLEGIFNRKERMIYGENRITSQPTDKDHLHKCIDLLRRTDILVSNSTGTFEMLAMYFDIPHIFVDNTKPIAFMGNKNYLTVEKPPLKAIEIINDLNDLEPAINKHLSDPSLLRKERKEELLKTAGVGIEGSPVNKIVNVINECIERAK